jgi:hypothetical protein
MVEARFIQCDVLSSWEIPVVFLPWCKMGVASILQRYGGLEFLKDHISSIPRRTIHINGLLVHKLHQWVDIVNLILAYGRIIAIDCQSCVLAR